MYVNIVSTGISVSYTNMFMSEKGLTKLVYVRLNHVSGVDRV